MATGQRIPTGSPIVYLSGPLAGQANEYLIKNWPRDTSSTNTIGTFQQTSSTQSTLSTTPVMLGMGWTFTPILAVGATIWAVASGSLEVVVSPPGGSSVYGATFQLYLGTGTPPVNGAAVTGTNIGLPVTAQLKVDNVSLLTTVDLAWPFTCQGFYITPAIDTYWVDIAANVGDVGQTGSWNNVLLTVQEVGVPA